MENSIHVSDITFSTRLVEERKKFFLSTNGGISLPLAGMLYWFGLAVLGLFVSDFYWTIISLYASGLIFPTAIWLSKATNSKILSKNPLGKTAIYAMMGMFLSYPMIIIGGMNDIGIFPLFLAIGMSIHWPVISWMYGSKSCFWHPVVRLVLSVSIWILFPDLKYTLLPLTVAIIYLLTIIGIKAELKKLRESVI